MGSRRKAREHALMLLFQADLGGGEVDPETLGARKIPDFALSLVRGVQKYREEIDRLLSNHLIKWRLERLAAVDRNVLRMAVYELVYSDETPPKVVIDEAIELGKKYGGEESGGFVNAVLDRILKEKTEEGSIRRAEGEQ